MDLNKQYELLAAQLGDITYKMILLESAKADLIEKIKELDKLAGMMNADAKKNEAQAESLSDGANSPG